VPDVHERHRWSIFVAVVVLISRKKIHDGVKGVNVASAQAGPRPFADTRCGHPLLKDVEPHANKKIKNIFLRIVNQQASLLLYS